MEGLEVIISEDGKQELAAQLWARLEDSGISECFARYVHQGRLGLFKDLLRNLLVLERTPTDNAGQCTLAIRVVSKTMARRAVRAFEADFYGITHSG